LDQSTQRSSELPEEEPLRSFAGPHMSCLDVLVAEPDPDVRARLARAVRARGHVCRTTSDGEEAWKMISERRPDVVIGDWHLSRLSGAELCRRSRVQGDDAPYVYFILVAGSADREHLLEGMAAGADDYQRRPIDVDEVDARLVSAARVIALHRRLAAHTDALARDSKAFYAASRTDALTGAGNRRKLDEDLAVCTARAKRYAHGYSLAMLDIDRFKDHNDAYGHIAGDEALKQVTSTIARSLRAGDTLYRYGGEELVVLLPEQSVREGGVAVERLRVAVESLAIRTARGAVLTVSAGVAELDPEHDTTTLGWLARADAALYTAKLRGRNRVECALGAPLRQGSRPDAD
jgi:two-component system, cell cycle response regulator